jgi:hypothetical protein
MVHHPLVPLREPPAAILSHPLQKIEESKNAARIVLVRDSAIEHVQVPPAKLEEIRPDLVLQPVIDVHDVVEHEEPRHEIAVEDCCCKGQVVVLVCGQQIEAGVAISLVTCFTGEDVEAAGPLSVLLHEFTVLLVESAREGAADLYFEGFVRLRVLVTEDHLAIVKNGISYFVQCKYLFY